MFIASFVTGTIFFLFGLLLFFSSVVKAAPFAEPAYTTSACTMLVVLGGLFLCTGIILSSITKFRASFQSQFDQLMESKSHESTKDKFKNL